MSPEPCKRKMVEIEGERYYIVVGEKFVQATTPEENFPANQKIRLIVETLCENISGLMEAQIERNTKNINQD